jgi:hypothetical protein
MTESVKTTPLFAGNSPYSGPVLSVGHQTPQNTKEILQKISFQGKAQKEKEKKAILRL